MKLSQIVALRGIKKQAKFLVSPPTKNQNAYYIAESGNVSEEMLNLHTGFMSSAVTQNTWVVPHALKFRVFKNGQPFEGKTAMLISDRTYIPLDPNATMKPKERERMAKLTDIARTEHAKERSQIGKGKQVVNDIAGRLAQGGLIILGILAVAGAVLKGCAG